MKTTRLFYQLVTATFVAGVLISLAQLSHSKLIRSLDRADAEVRAEAGR